MALTLEQVRHVASLARLTLSADEEQRYQHQLSDILEAVAELGKVNTDAVSPLAQAAKLEPLLRPDAVAPSLPPEESLRNAPAKSGTAFAVPKILE